MDALALKPTNKHTLYGASEQVIVARLTALWAFSEAGLGGVLHLFRSPFTGIFVGGIAVLILALIAYYSSNVFKDVLKALLIVLAVKLAVSPHSPLPAYLAVAFQGLLGAFLFSYLPHKAASMLLAVLALLESAFQKLILWTIVFGRSLWTSVDAFVEQIGNYLGLVSLSEDYAGSILLISAFGSIYLIAGFVIGLLAARLPFLIEEELKTITLPEIENEISVQKKGKRHFLKSKFFISFLFLSAIIGGVYLMVPEARQMLSPFWLLIRVVLIVFIWFVFLSPIINHFLKKYLKKKSQAHQQEMNAIISVLPKLRQLVIHAWRELKPVNSYKKWRSLIVRIISYCILYDPKNVNSH